MPSKKKPLNSRSKTTIFFGKIVKMSQYVEQFMIPQSNKLFFNNFTMRPDTKDEKVLIDKLQIGYYQIIYTQKLRYMYSYARNINAMICPNMKRHYIHSRQLFYGKKWVLMFFTYFPEKVIDSQLLHLMIYLVGLK